MKQPSPVPSESALDALAEELRYIIGTRRVTQREMLSLCWNTSILRALNTLGMNNAKALRAIENRVTVSPSGQCFCLRKGQRGFTHEFWIDFDLPAANE